MAAAAVEWTEEDGPHADAHVDEAEEARDGQVATPVAMHETERAEDDRRDDEEADASREAVRKHVFRPRRGRRHDDRAEEHQEKRECDASEDQGSTHVLLRGIDPRSLSLSLMPFSSLTGSDRVKMNENNNQRLVTDYAHLQHDN